MDQLKRLRAELEKRAVIPALISPEDGPSTIAEGRACGRSEAYHESIRLLDELAGGYGWATPKPHAILLCKECGGPSDLCGNCRPRNRSLANG